VSSRIVLISIGTAVSIQQTGHLGILINRSGLKGECERLNLFGTVAAVAAAAFFEFALTVMLECARCDTF